MGKSVAWLFAGSVVAIAASGGCGAKSNEIGMGGDDAGGDNDGSTHDASMSFGGGSSGGRLDNDASSVTGSTCDTGGGLACQVAPGCATTITGRVLDPAGKNPIYNAVVYVPNDPAGKLPAIQSGTNTCSSCDVAIGNYVTATTTDAKGNFKLTGVPNGSKIPLVIQIGKWRREVFLPTVKSCSNTALTPDQEHLPKNKSQGDMPQMALLTGLADSLGCFMARMGIDPAEFSAPHAGGRLDIYKGAGGAGLANGMQGNCTTTSCPLWSTKADLEKYDIVVLACEGGEHTESKSPAEIMNMHDWLNEGGKVFATHFHYVWFKDGPSDFSGAAQWLGVSSGDQNADFDIDTTFPKGQILHDWLQNQGQLTASGQIHMTGVANSVGTVNKPTQRWIYTGNSVKYLSLLTPAGGIKSSADAGSEMQTTYCGKAVFSDLHASGTTFALTIPDLCDTTTPMSAQEQALEFLFFDLSACVSDETKPPPIPPEPPK